MNLRDVLKMSMMTKREVQLQSFIFAKMRRIKKLERELYMAREEILFLNDLNNSIIKNRETDEIENNIPNFDKLYDDVRKKNARYEHKMAAGFRAKVRKEIDGLINGTR